MKLLNIKNKVNEFGEYTPDRGYRDREMQLIIDAINTYIVDIKVPEGETEFSFPEKIKITSITSKPGTDPSFDPPISEGDTIEQWTDLVITASGGVITIKGKLL